MFGRSSGKIDLPSVPAALARVIQVTNSTEATAEQVAGIVMLDQSLSTKVLRLANSAYYGRRVKVETITEAVVTLGFSAVRNLAASASVVDALFPSKLFPGFSWRDMWVHSVTCAVAAEAIHNQVTGRGRADESAFVAGLLHDIGKLILARALPHKFVQVVQTCQEYNFEMHRAEVSILSTDHTRIGGELAGQWEFPESLSAGITHHHHPESACEHEDIARSVSAGNLLSKRISKNYIAGCSVDISLKEIADVAGLRATDMPYTVDRVRERLQQCGEILSWGDRMPGAKMAA